MQWFIYKLNSVYISHYLDFTSYHFFSLGKYLSTITRRTLKYNNYNSGNFPIMPDSLVYFGGLVLAAMYGYCGYKVYNILMCDSC